MPTKSTTSKPAVPRKPRATKKTAPAVHKPAAKVVHHKKTAVVAEVESLATAPVVAVVKKVMPEGRYIFATGRRKTSVANVRLFSGKGESQVNKKPLDKYFLYSIYREEIGKPFDLTGLAGDYYFVCHVNGGGPHSQATAVQLGIANALGKVSEEVRKVLKKNGLLTRDDRKKERKKPGLKRARRSPQWAKR